METLTVSYGDSVWACTLPQRDRLLTNSVQKTMLVWFEHAKGLHSLALRLAHWGSILSVYLVFYKPFYSVSGEKVFPSPMHFNKQMQKEKGGEPKEGCLEKKAQPPHCWDTVPLIAIHYLHICLVIWPINGEKEGCIACVDKYHSKYVFSSRFFLMGFVSRWVLGLTASH